ncbi:hypothetical protein AR457_12655 [Streptomyces agglomeratus]|uniref:Secreted protein n=1 Tax=Streptomyces agglomeratus TaxID=285458 RepID=A0A1E5P6P3_9ACTN|nr:hypothetical protein [Streptomyces agglomeratus]OEJ25185.1 hypothetical protein AS594_12505 [Streptomyces agglomeratus]OEJ40786.1 hypothetical protein BGK70_23995 [Streptomyces agglomeratus]OEJ44833.1 hypothetical protein AR457_12655 [Streptomyces agglomeratus]OEJ53327.1 hypothetical protein BGK72_23595 [Streptomyces agglomeratus]OEJ60664.1 hypothetical protein BGM19_24305 [Streptomyces agglomeratus]
MKTLTKKTMLSTTALASAALTVFSAGSAQAAIKPGTTDVARVSNAGQTITTGLAGIDKAHQDTCKAGAGWNARVTWKLGKVTRTSIRVKSVKISYSVGETRKLAVGSVVLGHNTGGTVFSDPYPYSNRAGLTTRSHTINKTVKATKRKPGSLGIRASLMNRKPGEMPWCTPDTWLYFYIKPNR